MIEQISLNPLTGDVVPIWFYGLLYMTIIFLIVYGYRTMSAIWRFLAITLIMLYIVNPSYSRQSLETLPTIVNIITDDSQSQMYGHRLELVRQTELELVERLSHFANIEIRQFKLSEMGLAENSDLAAAVNQAMSKSPADQQGATFIISDGLLPQGSEHFTLNQSRQPLHTFVTGNSDAFDRRIELLEAPKFGIPNKPVNIKFLIEDQGEISRVLSDQANILVRINGQVVARTNVAVGQIQTLNYSPSGEGDFAIELVTDTVKGEISSGNNAVQFSLKALRDTFRVMLVTGEVYMGERVWRDFLKSDPGVDLVHLTILRTFYDSNEVPSEELSLIEFPTRTLFEEKIDNFDLIILDRFRFRSYLLPEYLRNMAKRVKEGGALLVTGGTDFLEADSIVDAFRAILNEPLLPVEFTQQSLKGLYLPTLTEIGKRHPVTRTLSNLSRTKDADQKPWGSWLHLAKSRATAGHVLLASENGDPILIVNRVGLGKVAVFTTDNLWLWARGYQGGGPHAELLRRLSHWLLNDRTLDEEALTAQIVDGKIKVERQTLNDTVQSATFTDTEGNIREIELTEFSPGLWRGEIPWNTAQSVLVENGNLKAFAAASKKSMFESEQVIAKTEPLKGWAERNNGKSNNISDIGDLKDIANIVLREKKPRSNSDLWIKQSQMSRVTGYSVSSFNDNIWVLLLFIVVICFMWYREGSYRSEKRHLPNV